MIPIWNEEIYSWIYNEEVNVYNEEEICVKENIVTIVWPMVVREWLVFWEEKENDESQIRAICIDKYYYIMDEEIWW